jgi:fructokinase
MMTEQTLYGGIEAGGTKFVCAVGNSPENIVDETRFPTTTPVETIHRVCDFLTPYQGLLRGVGLGSFGPVDVIPGSPTYGYITTTPKPYWASIDILGMLRQQLNIPVAFDSDVAAAAMGEFKWGASQGLDPSLYLTVGTGIGGGLIVNGKPHNGIVSPEMGHIRIPRDPDLDPFKGSCPYHGDCFEGLASGPAIQARFGRRAETLDDHDPYWSVEAGYIAYALVNYILILAPKKIVLGGGVMQKSFLFEMIREKVLELLNKYLYHPELIENIDEYIVPPLLGNRAGVLGGIALAMEADRAWQERSGK